MISLNSSTYVMPITKASAKLAYANSSDDTWMPNSRSAQHRRADLGVGLERGNRLERDDERQDEDAHRAFVGRDLGVEIRDGQQPHEHRDGRCGLEHRHLADFHRLACR